MAKKGRKPTLLGDRCKGCNMVLTEFNCYRHGIFIKSKCKVCYNDAEREKKYNVSREEYEKRLQSQSGVCAICKQPCKLGTRLTIDHNHSTNQIRDLLCRRCNAVLGLIEEDKELLCTMIDYLERHSLKVSG